MNTKTLAKINNGAIQLVENNGEKFVPIKPICEALGIDAEAQRQRIERDEILSSIAFMIKAVAADEKQREMYCLPFKFVFGWLFTIDTNRVSEYAINQVINYKLACYNALFDYFTSRADFVEQKQAKIDEQLEIVESAKHNFNYAKNILQEAENMLKKLRRLTIDDYDMERKQLKMNFEEI